MIAKFENTGQRTSSVLFQHLAKTISAEQVDLLKKHLKPYRFQTGERILAQNSQHNGLYMIESGQVVIQIVCEDGSTLRLRTLGAGAFFGEMGLYSGEPASADVVAEQPTSLLVLMADDLAALEKTSPQVAAALHRFIIEYMSERLAKFTATIQALL
ncbi:MAG: cyclic nucleotide-binding domain-containing protein [Anaerolineales bacterium]